MVVKCLLCLEYPTIPGPKFLEIFGEEGLRLDISAIINKYFWLKTNRNCEDVQQVCMTCWEVVRDFHILYQRVEEVHKHISVKTIVLDDPLPQDVMLKSEDDPSMAQDPIMGDNGMGDSIFDPEVKVEVHDLDLLPQIEILETANVSERSARSTRRGRPPAREQSPKVSTKRIKKEQSPAADATQDVFASNENLNKDSLNDSGSLDDDINYTLLSNSLDKSDKDESSSKRRGRPRKTETEKTKAITPRTKRSKKQLTQTTDAAIKNEQDAEDQPSCSTAAQQTGNTDETEPKIKTENSTDEQNYDSFAIAAENFEDDDAYAQDDYDDDNDNNYTKDSEDSSHSELESDASNDSDWGEKQTKKKEKFAVIMKKERNVPKKYKKREKPLVEPKRMSREEIEARQAQQAEYDSIITKFFEKIRCPKCELLVHTFGEMRAHFRLDHNDDHGFVECCGRRFATRKFLAEHILVHYNPEHFKCKTCDKVCRDSTQLESHEQTHLPNPPPSKYKKTFQCEKCSKTFSSKASFEHHMVAKHVPREEFKFECPECKKKCPTETKLKDHMRSVHDPQRTVICDKCGKTFKSTYSLKKHHELEHSDVPKPAPIPQQCEICGAWLRHLSGLKQHMKNIHEGVQTEHRCHICNKVSSTARALKRHIYHNHECIRKFQCTMCDKAFKRAQDLREHTSVHTGEVLYTCPNCPMTFFSNANMYKHRQRLHRAEWEADRSKPIPPNIMRQAKQGSKFVKTKRAPGETTPSHLVTPSIPIVPPSAVLNPSILYANMTWPSKAKLRKHMYCHDTNRQKVCDQCGKTFACNSSMQKHVNSEHSEIKPEPQQCKICNTWYRNMSGLRTHMKFMHENIGGEHRCQICNKVSSNARALRRHIYLNHECERKYKCHMCEKAFKREQDLREHISVHTGEALYTCPNCPMTFSSSANMYKHRQRLHKAEYAAHKQQPLALNIIKQAKSVPNTVRTKRRMIVEPPQPADIVMPPAASALLNQQHLVITSQYTTIAPNLTKLH